MKKLFKSFFRLFGFEIRRAAKENSVIPKKAVPKISPDTMSAGLNRVKSRNLIPATVIDLGAAAGTWTLEAMKYFPNAQYLLFEPLNERQSELQELALKHTNVFPVFAAVGNKNGTVNFMVSDDLDGSGVYNSESTGGNRVVDLVTIDSVCEKGKYESPFLIKFDTHGFEVPILEGAMNTLKGTTVIVMECYGFNISSDNLKFYEMCTYLEGLGFRLADIVNLKRRPGDELFWQCDAFFYRMDNPLFLRSTYS